MNGSTFGNIFKITTWGESHGKAIGVVIDGCPAGCLLRRKISRNFSTGGNPASPGLPPNVRRLTRYRSSPEYLKEKPPAPLFP